MGDYGFEGAGEFGGQDYFGEPEEILKATDAKMTQEYLKFLNDHQVTIVTKTALPEKPKKRKNNKIQVGDRIRIKEPLFFLRCGYDNNLQDQIAKVYQNEYEAVRQFAAKMGGLGSNAIEKIIRQIAYDRVGKQRHEGAERKIYTHLVEKYKDDTAWVASISHVKTGKYSAGYGGYDTWTGEYDYEPAYLSNEKTHRILELSIGGEYIRGKAYKTNKWMIDPKDGTVDGGGIEEVAGDGQYLTKIEDIHCELVE